jgi:glutathione S-transferase
MKLYYLPGACSLASHIVLREIGADFSLEKVNVKEQKTESGEDYAKVNPNGYVPALRFDDGDVLNEGVAVLQFLAEQHPDAKLLPAPGTRERATVVQYLSFVGSELHKAFSPFFTETLEGEARAAAEAKVAKRMGYIENLLSDGRAYLTGDQFTIADAYLFVVANWTNFVDIDLGQWPNVASFAKRVAARPTVEASMKAEGLLQ